MGWVRGLEGESKGGVVTTTGTGDAIVGYCD